MENIENIIIFMSNNYGSDIIPSLQAMNYIFNNYNIEYVYKIHTKNKKNILDKALSILNIDINVLINKIDNNICNCVGNETLITKMKIDPFNKKLVKLYKKYININKSFIASTIFFCHSNVIKKVLEFIENNNTISYFINNMYDTNMINYDNSPLHFIERLFGIINL